MTQHRLVHCEVSQLLAVATRRHPLPPSATVRRPGRRWFPRARPPGSAALSWSGRLPGPTHVLVLWWLEVEPAATGVLAHLTADAIPRAWPVPPPVTLALHAWSARELAALARDAETESFAA